MGFCLDLTLKFQRESKVVFTHIKKLIVGDGGNQVSHCWSGKLQTRGEG